MLLAAGLNKQLSIRIVSGFKLISRLVGMESRGRQSASKLIPVSFQCFSSFLLNRQVWTRTMAAFRTQERAGRTAFRC
jgi:hypothetical protein